MRIKDWYHSWRAEYWWENRVGALLFIVLITGVLITVMICKGGR